MIVQLRKIITLRLVGLAWLRIRGGGHPDPSISSREPGVSREVRKRASRMGVGSAESGGCVWNANPGHAHSAFRYGMEILGRKEEAGRKINTQGAPQVIPGEMTKRPDRVKSRGERSGRSRDRPLLKVARVTFCCSWGAEESYPRRRTGQVRGGECNSEDWFTGLTSYRTHQARGAPTQSGFGLRGSGVDLSDRGGGRKMFDPLGDAAPRVARQP